MHMNDSKQLFQITSEELRILTFIAQTNPPGIPDEWDRLGRQYGFDSATVEPADAPERFWARPTTPPPAPKWRHK